MISGVSVSDTQMIPPQQKLYRNVGICGPSCTNSVCKLLLFFIVVGGGGFKKKYRNMCGWSTAISKICQNKIPHHSVKFHRELRLRLYII